PFSTQMISAAPATTTSTELSTHSKIIAAALNVFARDGIPRATTRIIAEEAGVNEVTLFRHFTNKDGLLQAVFDTMVDTPAYESLDTDKAWVGTLHDVLRNFGLSLYQTMERDEAFIRTLIGESRRLPEQYRKIAMEAIKPLRSRFRKVLERGQENGEVRKDLNLFAAMDMFTNMLMAGMLKNTVEFQTDYTSRQYVNTCVEVFMAGISPQRSRH
ncbi:MAG: TetR/AcrR family transcriptional regulator, partial [Roseimicrobium sp.]